MLLCGPSQKVLISGFVQRKSRNGIAVCSWRDAEILIPSGAKKHRISKEKKRKDLAVIAKTLRLNHVFPAKLSSSNFEAVTLTTAFKNVGENQA